MSASLHFDLPGFSYAHLYHAERLPLLDKLFLEALKQGDPMLAERYVAYRKGGGCEGPAESALLIAVARYTEDFLVSIFRVSQARDALRAAQARDEVIHTFKEKFVKHHARKKRVSPARPFFDLDALLPIPSSEDREHVVADEPAAHHRNRQHRCDEDENHAQDRVGLRGKFQRRRKVAAW